MNTQSRMMVLLMLAAAACGPAPTGRPPAVTVVFVTTPPPVVTATSEVLQTAPAIPRGPFPPESVSWLKSHAIPFVTSQPGSGFDDLEPLRNIVGPAQIVSLGEATHGTHEFFQMKHRLLENLVNELAFNSFAMETSWPEANLLNDYVQTGQGDPKQLLAGLGFWTWNTQEVLDLVLWMRANNAHAGNRHHLSFYGFDIQSPWLAMINVVEYLQEVNPRASAWADGRYDCLRQYRNAGSKYAAADITLQRRCRSALQAVYDLLVRRQAIYGNITTASDYNHALQSARIILQAEHFYAGLYDSAARDEFMAENVTWLQQQAGPDSRIVLWAHNQHVGAIRDELTGTKSMGWYLRQTYGANMVIFGFSLYRGSFNAVSSIDNGLKSHPLPAPLPDSYESFFHSADLPRLFLDLRGVLRDLTVTAWLLGPHPVHTFGGLYGENFPWMYVRSARLPQEYDVMVYFQDTTPSILLPFPTQ